jgi:cytochrome P450 / NADPH-cytochrome P450 reductase
MIVQRFDLMLGDPNYTLKIKQTLTIKPQGFSMRVRIREGYSANRPSLADAIPKEIDSDKSAIGDSDSTASGAKGKEGLLVLYGSNSGSSEGFAQTIGEDAAKMGFWPITVGPMDEFVGQLPTHQMSTAIVTCSYEGKPADNAHDFVAWIESLEKGKSLNGVKYMVFGCGHKDWVDTYQRIPKLIDEKLESAGATRIYERGEANAAGDFVGDFDSWREKMWKQFGTPNQAEERTKAGVFDVKVVPGKRQDVLKLSDLDFAHVLKNEPLVTMDGEKYSQKLHIEIQLPHEMTYLPGHYLQVLPTNGSEAVQHALTYFGLDQDDSIIIKKTAGHVRAQFPTDTPVNVQQVLECYVELTATASRNQIKVLANNTTDEKDKAALNSASDSNYESDVLSRRISILDLLPKYPSVKLPIATFLEISTPMRVRQYSISSSPSYLGEGKCSLTVAVLQAPAKSGKGIYKGLSIRKLPLMFRCRVKLSCYSRAWAEGVGKYSTQYIYDAE